MASNDPGYSYQSPNTFKKPLRSSAGSMASIPATLADEKYGSYDDRSTPLATSGMNDPLLSHGAPMAGHSAPSPLSPPMSTYSRTDTIGSKSSYRRTADVPITGINLPFFQVRAVLSILIPIVLVGYYYMTYWRWLRFPEGSPLTWTRRGYLDSVDIVNYSWFVLGTFALNLGTYCLAGSVASMVMRRRWGQKNLKRLMLLASNTFQDPAGWITSLIKLFKRDGFKKRNGLLWDILAFFSIIGFAAWPLTGLTMQTEKGFSIDPEHIRQDAWVVGRNFTNINGRDGVLTTERVTDFWSLGFSPSLPLRQQIYTLKGSSLEMNVTEGNSMPDDASESIFLAAQASGPLIGEAFGLAVRYNCSIVNSTSQFTILNRRNETLNFDTLAFGSGAPGYGYTLPDQSIIFLRNKTRATMPISLISNVNASLELGTSIKLSNITDPTDSESIGYVELFGSYPGIDEPVIIEAALWQNIVPIDIPGVPKGFVFQDTKNDIEELRDSPLYPGQKAVGVRCQASSAIGTAYIDGVSGTYSNFKRVSANPRNGGGIKRFEMGIPHMILQTPYISSSFKLAEDVDWFGALYASIERSSMTTNKFGDFVGGAPGVLQAEDLRQALLRAYKTYAVHIMYDGLSDPSYTWRLANVTLGREQDILTRGAVLPEAVLVMLTIWGLSIVILAIAYQFRRRWTETIDGYTIFRFGVDRPEDLLPEMLTSDFDTAAVLESLPGMIGDLEPNDEVGYIGLVRSGEVNWNKRFG